MGSSSDTNFDQDFHKFCFTIDVEDRNKKHAWFEAGQIMRKVQRFFKMNDIIPDETSLTVRKAETRLNRNRRRNSLLRCSMDCNQDCLFPFWDLTATIHWKILKIIRHQASQIDVWWDCGHQLTLTRHEGIQQRQINSQEHLGRTWIQNKKGFKSGDPRTQHRTIVKTRGRPGGWI